MTRNKWGTYGFLNLSESQRNDPNALQELRNVHVEFKGSRSKVIEAALFIESRLEVLLGLFFCSRYDVVRLSLFDSLVPKHEFCTLSQKCRMLKGALKAWNTVGEKQRKALTVKLTRLMEERNLFAHGDLYVEARSKKMFIKMGSSGYQEVTQRRIIDYSSAPKKFISNSR